jgi:hypothetical protein
MSLAEPSNYASQAFGFLSKSPGQIVLAIASVVFIVLVKSFLRPSGEHQFQKDDLLVGPDLLVLAIVTLIGYAASQFVAEGHADAIPDFKAAGIYSSHQVNAAVLSLVLICLLFFETLLIQRYGQFSSAKRVQDRSRKIGEEDRIRGLLLAEERRTRVTTQEEPAATPENLRSEVPQELSAAGEKLLAALQENLKEFLDVPRYKIAGLVLPDLLGIFMLIVAIKSAVQ